MERIIKLTKKDMEKAEAFTRMRCGQNADLYKRRGGFKPQDILIGALAELGVHRLLKQHGIRASEPDFAVYGTRGKSFNSDLHTKTKDFHIKGQSLESAKKYGASWLMQRTDPLFRLEESGHFLVPCNVDLERKEVVCHGIFAFSTLLAFEDVVFSECAIPSFRRTKRALYLENLDIISDKARWSILYGRNK